MKEGQEGRKDVPDYVFQRWFIFEFDEFDEFPNGPPTRQSFDRNKDLSPRSPGKDPDSSVFRQE